MTTNQKGHYTELGDLAREIVAACCELDDIAEDRETCAACETRGIELDGLIQSRLQELHAKIACPFDLLVCLSACLPPRLDIDEKSQT